MNQRTRILLSLLFAALLFAAIGYGTLYHFSVSPHPVDDNHPYIAMVIGEPTEFYLIVNNRAIDYTTEYEIVMAWVTILRSYQSKPVDLYEPGTDSFDLRF